MRRQNDSQSHRRFMRAVSSAMTLSLGLLFGPQVAAAANSSVPPSKSHSRAKAKAKDPVAPVDWAKSAEAELVASNPKPNQSVKSLKRDKKAKVPLAVVPAESDFVATVADRLPTPATVRAEVKELQPAIEHKAMKLGFSLEPYRPVGGGVLASGQRVSFENATTSVMAELNLRWLPFEFVAQDRAILGGGFAAVGYSRQGLPIVAGSGFRYDDVALNSVRLEAGVELNTMIDPKLAVGVRSSLGQLTIVQTSKYPEVTGSFSRNFLSLGIDAAYYLDQRWALVGSLSKRIPVSAGTIEFDTVLNSVSVAGGLLVQVR